MIGIMTEPRCYFWRDGAEIVAQNWVGVHQGQEHRHTPEDWARWRAEAERDGWIIEELQTKGN